MEVGVRFGRRMWVVVLAAAVLGISGAAYAGGGWLGVMLQPLSEEIGEAMNLDSGTTGVLVSDVVDGSPADAAGVEKGDVIVEIDGTSVVDVEGAIASVKNLDPGTTVKMVVVRDGKKQVLTAELGDRADMSAKLESKDDDEDDEDEEYYNFRVPRVERFFKNIDLGQGGYIGVEVRDISADLGSYFGVGCCEGVLVLEVMDGSPAATAGLKAGDVIIKADGEDVRSSGEFAAFVRGHEPGDKLEVTFKRSKETRRVVVDVGENDSSKIFLNMEGQPDVFRMCGKEGELRQKCLELGGQCRMLGQQCKMMGKECKMMGRECAERCKMMGMDPGKCCMMMGMDPGMCCKMMGEGDGEKNITCKVKVGEGPDKDLRVMVMERPDKGEGCPMKAMHAQGEDLGCPMKAMQGDRLPCMEGEGPARVKVIRRDDGPRAELEAEIEALKQEIQHLKQEMEALR